MNPQDAIDFSREAIKTCMMVGGPILAASLLIGLLVGVFQAMTQVQDQTVSFVPKILLLILTIGLCLPWLTDQMMDFAKHSFEKPMTQWAGTSRTRLFPKQDSPMLATPESLAPISPTTPRKIAFEMPKKTEAWFDESNLDFNRAVDSNPTLDVMQSETKSPFILPHYRISKAPVSENDGG